MVNDKSPLISALTESEDIINKISKSVTGMLKGSLQEQISSYLTEGFNDDEKEEDEVTDDVTKDSTDLTNELTTDDHEKSDDVEPKDDTETSDEDDLETDDTESDVTDGVDIDMTPDDSEVLVTEPIDTDISDVMSDVVDATNMSDDELLKVFKKIDDTTEIEVIKNNDGTIDIKKDGQEYVVKINENKESFLDNIIDDNTSENNGDDDEKTSSEPESSTDNEVFYEMTIEGDDEDNGEELDETRSLSVGHSQIKKPEGFMKYASDRLRASLKESVEEKSKLLIKEANDLRNEKQNLLNENENLKVELEKHKEGLRKMNKYLNEALLLNQKIFHVNKIFCEHVTTVDEKKRILERFDNEDIKDEKDVQSLYKTVVSELKTTVNESLESKLQGNLNGSTGDSLLNESQNYNENKGNNNLERIKKLMYK